MEKWTLFLFFWTHQVTPGSPHSPPPLCVIAIYYRKNKNVMEGRGESSLKVSTAVCLVSNRCRASWLHCPLCLASRHSSPKRMITTLDMHLSLLKKKKNKKKLLGSNYFSYFVKPFFWETSWAFSKSLTAIISTLFSFLVPSFWKAEFAFVLLSFRAPMLLWTWGWLMLRTYYQKDSHLWKRP